VVGKIAPARLLEVGVGTGLMLERYPAATAVVGIDISQEMLDIACGRARELQRSDVQLLCMDAETTSFADGSFDCVVLPYVLSVTPDPAKLVREVRRVCRPGGTILILNHFSGSRFWWALEALVRPLAARVGFRSNFPFDEQVKQHGWTVDDVREVNLFGLSRLVTISNA
jgi:phosphatidylethanolamine/phosphatidyl-N-methylethanolamine N-methyltransferase